jgi:hypothetical protein
MNYCSFSFEMFNDPERLGEFREKMKQVAKKHAKQKLEGFKQKFTGIGGIILDELNFDYRELCVDWNIDQVELGKVYKELEKLYIQQCANEIKKSELEVSNIGLDELIPLYISKCTKLKIAEEEIEWLKKQMEQARKIQALGG